MSGTIKTYVTVPEGAIFAEYSGGAYIDLTFAGSQPSEVINVWDYQTDKPEIPATQAAVEAAVQSWAAETAAEWPTYFEDYVKNAKGEN